ncbi:hypothetical protein A167_03167 [Alcanivorax sp. S71-1-4]|jgi:type IV pilus assembly protein PilX|uniref:PilX N-terminal domain-containing pilus assembly protein n=1 Tax=Alcanivorax sp. S71-1-4 TaxID=1177159 RepID=UPI001356C6D8|nr:PilX N-terminal domain-containing pilus assembly protein [Alcanivorax sp. S71-1-4]KAF0806625.1 hypothetical protein A167_03167 [Alcanivorax sp. S71-1-4]
MRRSVSMPQKEHGLALMVALLVLVIISVLGITAMRTSMFNARVALGAQTSVMVFQGAESAINAVVIEAIDENSDLPNHVIGRAMRQLSQGVVDVQQRCVTAANPSVVGACGADDFLDARSRVKAGSRTIVKRNVRAAPGTQISSAGSSTTSFGFYDFITVAEAEIPAFNLSEIHVQEMTRFGLRAGDEL